ncbi:MAG: cytochrome c [Acidobacteria bacterium]|nr:cytochrome c [Acidobacteriota bacterium]
MKTTHILLGAFALLVLIALAGRSQEAHPHNTAREAGAKKKLVVLASKGNLAVGRSLSEKHCQTCHEVKSNKKKVGPGLKGLFKWPAHKMADGTVMTRHDEPTIRKQIEEGSSSMPPMKGVLSKQELDDLMAYLRSL